MRINSKRTSVNTWYKHLYPPIFYLGANTKQYEFVKTVFRRHGIQMQGCLQMNLQHGHLTFAFATALQKTATTGNAIITEYSQFFIATNLELKRLLKPSKYKDIVINSMRFLIQHKE